METGFDRFSPALIGQYLGRYAENKLGISVNDLLALGRRNPDDSSEPFNMAYLAVRGSGAANGVSRLHGRVSRRISSSLFPRWPGDEVPVGRITNGVPMPPWDSAVADEPVREEMARGQQLVGQTHTSIARRCFGAPSLGLHTAGPPVLPRRSGSSGRGPHPVAKVIRRMCSGGRVGTDE